MATAAKRLPANVAGDFYVDSTCIDCGTCRQIAPATFAEGRDWSYVHRQPTASEPLHRARMALGSRAWPGERLAQRLLVELGRAGAVHVATGGVPFRVVAAGTRHAHPAARR